MRNTNKKGFTIVELVIVIAVIAILAAVLIPTFTGIIRRANQSADQQAVANMNKILSTEEALGNKPTSPMEVLDILRDNGFNYSMKPYYDGYTLGWLASENVVVLVKDNAVAFPKEYEGKTDYSLFIAVESDPAKLQAALADLKPGEVLVITEDLNATSTLDFNFVNTGSYGLDLNGNTLTSDHSIDEESSIGGTFKNVVKVSAGDVVFANGTITADGNGTNTCLYVTDTATVTINNMTFDNTAATGKTCLLADYNDETVVINDSVVKGAGNAIQAYESTIILNNVTATSANSRADADYLNSAIGLGADAGGNSASVTVNSGTYTGKYFVSVFGANVQHTITINGGTFNGNIYDTNNWLTIVINGGTFNTNDAASIQRIQDAVQPGCTITINGESFSK